MQHGFRGRKQDPGLYAPRGSLMDSLREFPALITLRQSGQVIETKLQNCPLTGSRQIRPRAGGVQRGLSRFAYGLKPDGMRRHLLLQLQQGFPPQGV